MQNAVCDGQVVNLKTDARFEMWRSPVPATINASWQNIQSRGYSWHEIEDNEIPGDEIWDFSIAWHRQMRHCTTMAVFLQVGEQPLGFMGLCFSERVQPSSEQVELILALAQQAALAIQLTRLAEEAKQAVVLEERNRMAREIHDTLAQGFTGVIIQLEAAQGIMATQPEVAQAHFARASSLARQGLSEARRSVWALRPEALLSESLANALSRLVQQMTTGTTVRAEVCLAGTPYPLSPEVELNLLRIGQEALTNVLRHAKAQVVRFQLQFDTAAVQLQIADDGQGFEPQLALAKGGFGLLGMQERSQQLAGQLTITSQIGQGSEINITVPTRKVGLAGIE